MIPAAVALGFAEAGVPWLHVVDLDGARTGGRHHGATIAAIAAAVGATAPASGEPLAGAGYASRSRVACATTTASRRRCPRAPGAS